MPAVSGRFYPADPAELTALIKKYASDRGASAPARVKACLVPHAGYVYSGHVAGAVYARIEIPQRIVILGVRHRPRGEKMAILSSGAWRTPLGDAPIDESLAKALREACPLLREDSVAHHEEHSLEVQVPFLQLLRPGFSFVPIALGTVHFDELVAVGESLWKVIGDSPEQVLLLTTSDLNHYEDDAKTRVKDHKAIEKILALDAWGLYETCQREAISMCGLGPTVAMITAAKRQGCSRAELVRYATSADVSGDLSAVVGYAGIVFS